MCHKKKIVGCIFRYCCLYMIRFSRRTDRFHLKISHHYNWNYLIDKIISHKQQKINTKTLCTIPKPISVWKKQAHIYISKIGKKLMKMLLQSWFTCRLILTSLFIYFRIFYHFRAFYFSYNVFDKFKDFMIRSFSIV